MKRLIITTCLFFVSTIQNFGQTYFTKSFGSSGMACTGKGVAQGADNALYFIGNYVNLLSFEHGMELSKIDSLGNIVWRKLIGPQTAHANRIIYSLNHELIIVGQVDDSAGNADALILKSDTTGQIIYNKTFGSLSATEMFAGVAPNPNGGFVLSGFSSHPSGNGNAIYLVAVDSAGNGLWDKVYSYNVNAVGDDISSTPDGNYVLGSDKKTASIDYNAQVLKINASGNIIWNTDITFPYNSGCKNIMVTSNGNYLLAGEAATATSAYFDPFLTLLDTAGNILWSHTIACGNGPEAAYDVIEYAPQQYMITGFGLNSTTGNTDLMIMYLDSNGFEVSKQYFGNSGYDQAFNIIMHNDSSSFFAAGMTLVNGEAKYFLVHQPIINTTSIDEPFSQLNFTVYPNPADDVIAFNFAGSYTISNVLGQCVIKTKSQQINISQLPRGLYLVDASIGSKIVRTKFLKQ
jgi:hypothetical protein